MKKKLATYLKSYNSVPLVLLLVAGLSFALMLPKLGFYFDDWETILTIKVFGLAKMWDYFQGPRPLASWTYFLFTPFVGTSPLGWQILSLGLRWLTVSMMWWVFCQVWPEHRFSVTLAAFLFLVYPMFVEQPIAVSYHQHWTSYLLYFISLALMILAVRQPARYLLWTLLSFVEIGLHLAVLEYFVGVELLRPLVLFFLPQIREFPTRARIRETIKRWLPYLALLGLFVAVRLIYSFRLVEDANRPKFLQDLLHAPLAALSKLWPIASKDTLYAFFTAWYKTLPLNFFELRGSMLLLTLGVGLLLVLLLGFYLARLSAAETRTTPMGSALEEAAPEKVPAAPVLPERFWPGPMLLIGVAAFLLGMLPAWVIYRQASETGLYLDRYGLPAMFGVSLVWVAFLDWLTPARAKKALLVGVLVALATGVHLQTADSYRLSWTRQLRVAWQLYWRAPDVQPETVFLSDSSLFNYVFPTFMLNTLYHNSASPESGLYTFYYTKDVPLDPVTWQGGYKIDYQHRNMHFTGSGLNSLVLFYEPSGASSCLWVLRPDDRDDPVIPASARSALVLVNLSRISPQPRAANYPAQDIFGSEPAHDWCYYYQKAELARQQEDWAAIVALEDAALEKGYSPTDSRSNAPHEWIPFILGDGHQGRWDQALELTQESARIRSEYQPVLCRVWAELAASTPVSTARDSAYQQIRQELACGAPAQP